MPYITQGQRNLIEPEGEPGQYLIDAARIDTPGDLNYVISVLAHHYARRASGGITYSTANEVMGVLDCVRMEFYRSVVAPYEDKMAIKNGPVSELDAPFFDKARNPLSYEG